MSYPLTIERCTKTSFHVSFPESDGKMKEENRSFKETILKSGDIVLFVDAGVRSVISYLPIENKNITFAKNEYNTNLNPNKLSFLGAYTGAIVMDSPDESVRNQKGEATVRSRGYVEHVLNPDLFNDDFDDIDFHLDHTSNKMRKIETTVKNRGYLPHQLYWDEEEEF